MVHKVKGQIEELQGDYEKIILAKLSILQKWKKFLLYKGNFPKTF